MVIRPATVDDVPRIVEMGVAFLRASPYHDVLAENRTQMAALATQLLTTGTVLVADEGGALFGMIGLIASPHFLSGEMYAGEVFWWVEPGRRGAGLRLWRAAEAWATAQGAVTLQMIAPDDRVATLYERRGYQPLDRSFVIRLPRAA